MKICIHCWKIQIWYIKIQLFNNKFCFSSKNCTNSIEIYLAESDVECDCDIRGEIDEITEESILLKDGNTIKLKDIAYISKRY